MPKRLNYHLTKLGAHLITAALIVGMVGCDGCGGGPPTLPPSQNLEIRTWYDLDRIRDNLAGNHTLMNDLDSTTLGYEELASPIANEGKGWQPIAALIPEWGFVGFMGTFDGQGHEIRDLFISRPDEDFIGLFRFLEAGESYGIPGEVIIKDIGVVNVTVAGKDRVGGLVGQSVGAVSNSYSTGSVTGNGGVAGLVGENDGTVDSSYSTGSVTGQYQVGGLAGLNGGAVINSHFTGALTSDRCVGGLVGRNQGTVSNSYSSGSVTGNETVGGLVGSNEGTVSNSYSNSSVTGSVSVGGLVGSHEYSTASNSYYNYDEVLINGENMITVGALFGKDFHQWLDNDKFLNVNERLSQENGYYVINSVSDFKQLLAFGQNATLTFRLTNDLDLGNEPNFYIPYLAGEFDGNGHKIFDLSLSYDSVSPLGLFGYLAAGGKVTDVGLENINITGYSAVGGLVGGTQEGTLGHCYATGTVTGNDVVGGLVGDSNFGLLSDSYSTANVTGYSVVGGLIGGNHGTVDRSYSTGRVTGNSDVGGLVGSNLRDVSNSYATGRVTGDDHVGGLVGLNLGLATVSNSYCTGSVIGNEYVGGLVGYNSYGAVSSSYSTGSVSGRTCVGGLVGCSEGGESKVEVSYSTATVVGNEHVGGLVGWGLDGAIIYWSYSTGSVAGTKWVGGLVGNLGSSDYLRGCSVEACYSTGSVTGSKNVGGLVGELKNQATVGGFWDTQSSGQATSAGGTGKTTAEMKNIATFTEAGWNIIAVGLDETDPVHIWNIVNGITYPFLSWHAV
jgi:hypothetical protein